MTGKTDKMEPVERDELMALLPHKGKMFLLSRLRAYDLERGILSGEYDITGDCLFYNPALGGIPSWVGVELMAQSISALSGLKGRLKGKKPNPGFILSVSNMRIDIPVLKAGTTAVITIRQDCQMDTIYTFYGVVAAEGKEAVEAKLTVMEVDDISVLRNQ
jgi:predicted hotdog family 3-hydroxylacyl-ACP dehydratase